MTDVLPEPKGEIAPTFCYFCDRRAVLVEGGGPHAFCIKCIDASAKRFRGAAWPTDPAILFDLSQLFGMR
jgi:hypothetical protein